MTDSIASVRFSPGYDMDVMAKDYKTRTLLGLAGEFRMSENENMVETNNVEKTCPNCQHFYEHGKTEWEDSPKCEDCTHRGGYEDNWKAKAQIVSEERKEQVDSQGTKE